MKIIKFNHLHELISKIFNVDVLISLTLNCSRCTARYILNFMSHYKKIVT